jgi:hypothetical protein
VLAAVAGISRRDGWKPSAKTLRKLLPQRTPTADAQAAKKQAQKVTAENPGEDTSWIDFIAGKVEVQRG